MSKKSETAKVSEFFAEIAEHDEAERFDVAYALAERLAQAAPQMAQAQNAAGLLSLKLKNHAQALNWFEKAMALAPTVALYPRNAALALYGANQPDEALKMTERALALAPEESALHFNKALVLYDQKALDAGLAAVNRALELAPDYEDAHFLKSELQLLAGKLTEGWESYEHRFALKQGKDMLPKTSKPQWDGRKLGAGRLLVVADQGFGDSIQFARYLPWVVQRAPQPILAASKELMPLLSQLPGIGRTIRSWDEAGAYDAFIPLSGLPRLAGTTIATIPAQAPYLRADPAKLAIWQERLAALVPAGLKRIGLVWAGRPAHMKDNKRTVKLSQFKPLLERDDLAVITLQKGDRVDEIGMNFSTAPVINLGPSIADFTDTLAILQLLDRLVTVDTSVAHLAGASGVKTALILPYAPDWRWLLDRDDSPWYPSMRLFRQERPGDWAGLITRLNENI